MFYKPQDDVKPAPLTHNPINAIVSPRPIGWIGSCDKIGNVNLAPFSYFNVFSADPPVVAFAPNSKDAEGTPKDTLANVMEVPEFTVSIVSAPLSEKMNQTSASYPRGTSEFTQAGLTAAPSQVVKPPHVGEAKAVLECRVYDIHKLPSAEGGRQSHLVIGEVIGIHIDDDLIVDGKVDELAIGHVSRLGYFNYSNLTDRIVIPRPEDP